MKYKTIFLHKGKIMEDNKDNRDTKEYWYVVAQEAIKRIVELQYKIKELECKITFQDEVIRQLNINEGGRTKFK